MQHLAGFPKLRRLSLQSTDVTDAGMPHLAGLAELKTLSLESTSVSNYGLDHLRELKRLENLNVMYTRCNGLLNAEHLVGLKKPGVRARRRPRFSLRRATSTVGNTALLVGGRRIPFEHATPP